MTKFKWQATESAPKNNPMEIIAGTLHYHGEDGGLYVPSRSLIDYGWGSGTSSHVVGDDRKPLPDRLSITFFSYLENQFYRGSFQLPYEKILELFQKGFYSYVNTQDITYDQIIVGVAPGGAVSVWVSGLDRTVELFFGYAEKADVEWSTLTSATHISREEYVKKVINDSLRTPEAQQDFERDGIPFGRWERYHKARYPWQPLFTNMPLFGDRITIIDYYNGESDYIDYPVVNPGQPSTRAVPRFLDFTWDRPDADPMRIEFYFDEAEIFDAFARLGKDNLPMKLEMRIEVIDNKYDFTVWLRNERDSIKIKKFAIETYGIPQEMIDERKQ